MLRHPGYCSLRLYGKVGGGLGTNTASSASATSATSAFSTASGGANEPVENRLMTR